MDKKLVELVFKCLATGILPVFFWVNSLSVKIALSESSVNSLVQKVQVLESEQKKIHEAMKDNQASLKEMRVTVEFIKQILVEIRSEMRLK